MLGVNAASRHEDDGEDAAGRRPVWLLGDMPGEPSHEPRGEDWHSVEILPAIIQTLNCSFDFYSRVRTLKTFPHPLLLLSLCRDQVLEMFDHAYGSYMVPAALPAFANIKTIDPHPSVRLSTPSVRAPLFP